MKIEIEHGMGNAVLNAVRSAAFLSCQVTRPIAFKVGNASNVVSISDAVMEDMTTFISKVSSFDFAASSNEGLVVVDAVCDGELTIGELLAGGGVLFSGENTAILHSITPVNVSVVFATLCGNRRIADNAKLLEEARLSGYVPINSRHCCIDAFTYKVVDVKDDCDIFDVSIMAKGIGEREVFNLAASKVIGALKCTV